MSEQPRNMVGPVLTTIATVVVLWTCAATTGTLTARVERHRVETDAARYQRKIAITHIERTAAGDVHSLSPGETGYGN